MAKSTDASTVLILSYYWPPSGGSGVQRWMYFAKHLETLGWEPIVITVDARQASYPVLDPSLIDEVKNITVISTATREPLRWYKRWSRTKAFPQAEVPRKTFFQKMAAFIRGNFFIPDARKGWVPFALQAAEKACAARKVKYLITTGPPHSTHLIGLKLQKKYPVKWWVDLRDPWGDLFYNKDLYRLAFAQRREERFEREVLQSADGVITTIGGEFHQQLRQKAPQQRFIVLPNGYDKDLIQKTKAAPAPASFHLVFTGILTHKQAYPALLWVLKKLQFQYRIQWTLAGQIAPEILTTLKQELPQVNINFLGYLPHNEAIALIKSGDLLLNFIFEGAQKQMISGKLLEYIATGVPILSIGNPKSAAAEVINQGTAAQMLDPKDETRISSFIEECIHQKGKLKNTFPQLEQWSRKAITQRLINEILDQK